MSNPIVQHQEASSEGVAGSLKGRRAAYLSLFEVGALDGEPFMSIWCQLDRAIDRTQRLSRQVQTPTQATMNPSQASCLIQCAQMIANVTIVTLALFLVIAFTLLERLRFLAPFRNSILAAHQEVIIGLSACCCSSTSSESCS